MSAPAQADRAAVQIAARYNVRTVHVQFVGVMYNGKQEVGGSSGLLIGDSLVLTNSHVIGREENYKSFEVNAHLGPRNANPIKVPAVHRDDARDLALLDLSQPAGNSGGASRCPMPVIDDNQQAPMGTQLYLLGYPLDLDLSISSGLISNQTSPNGRWQTNTVVNVGSGGPAFNEFGALLGIAVGGIVKWNEADVFGVNFIIPATVITASPLYSMIAAIPQPSVCWTKWVETTISFENWTKLNSTHVQTQANAGVKIPEILSGAIHTLLPEDRRLIVNVPVSQLIDPKLIERAYTVDKTKDDHPVVFAEHSADYAETFPAEPGYRITGCTWHVETANGASNIGCAINGGGAEVRFTYRLTSVPAVDRYRGWLGATVNVSQTPAK
ncbi:S1 family peptidase [Bradyrhizobium sp. WSM471]|uniref:S1 family peptidase n=1 Tax=Bradyrhizobium sp. WSM471 TaxID=319017 RepID=UPI00024D22D1|nr:MULTISPECIES: serine protease [Bradyrhizobium]EHR00820.1 trypsin-like serine protease with C-terminal PDZ domain [Bradyrhizobium sp. WSM471]UFW42898.1 serine protease [Bradyrhizobium canariense]